MGAFTKDLFIRYLFVPFFRGLVWTIATDTELNNCYLEVYNVELFFSGPVQTSNFTSRAELNGRGECMWSATFESIKFNCLN